MNNPDENDANLTEENPGPAYPPPAVDEVQRVDAEPVEDKTREQTFGDGMGGFAGPRVAVYSFSSQQQPGMPLLKPPAIATWLCLGLAWLFLGSKLPFTIILGIPTNLIALLLAAVCLTRGGVFTGIFVFILGTAGSLIVYLVGLFRFLTMLG